MVPANCTRSALRLSQLLTEVAPTPALPSWQMLTRPAHRNCCGSATALSSVRMRASMTPRPSRLGLRRRAARTSTPGRSEAEAGVGRARLSRGAEEKRPVSFISAPSFCGVAEPSLVLLANPNVAASALLRRVVACFAYSELKTDRTDTVAELSRVWTLAWAGRARGD